MVRSSAMVRRASTAGAVLLLALAACTHVKLISSYDEPTDKGITAVHAKVDALFTQLDAAPMPTHDAVRPSYEAIHADIASLRLRNEARPSSQLTVKQLDELRATLDTFEQQHEAQKLSRAMLAPARDIVEQACRAILTLELAKKELKD